MEDPLKQNEYSSSIPKWLVHLFIILFLFYFSYTRGVESGFIVNDWYFNLSYDFMSLRANSDKMSNFALFFVSGIIALEHSVKFIKKFIYGND